MKATHALALAFARHHPRRVAELGETAPVAEFAGFLEQLPAEVAAQVVARAAPGAAARAVQTMTTSSAAALLNELNPRITSALLRRLDDTKNRELLDRLLPKLKQQVDQLLNYSPDQAGSRMDPQAPAVSEHSNVEHAREILRQAREGALSYVFVVDEQQKLSGVCSIRELMCSGPDEPVSSIMTRKPLRLVADEPLTAVVAHPGWRKVHALPVVDETGSYLGAFRYSSFRALEAELGRAGAAASRPNTRAALAELFWLGASAMVHLGETAMTNVDDPSKGSQS